MGVVRMYRCCCGCCCKEVYRIPHNITYPYSTCVLALFLLQHPYFFVQFFIVFRGRKKKNAKSRLFTSRGAYINCAVMTMLYTHLIVNQP